MKKRNIKSWSLLILLFMITTMTACGIKDKKTVISKNVSNEAKVANIEIQRDIELGNKYLQEGKYDEAKNSYDKAIYMDPTNKQSYLKIKDKYMAKGRIDDGFYIIKLAIKNNVDVANMNVILDGIRKKFGITTIEKNLYENNKFEMPKSVIINVNKVKKLVNIKWDKVEMNTSLVGTYYCNGIADQYERPVKLTLNVLPEKSVATTTTTKQSTSVSTTQKPSQASIINYNDITEKTKNYITNGQGNMPDADKLIWNTTLLNRVDIVSLYKQYISNGGNKDDIGIFAKYMTKNAPIQSDWKAVFEKALYSEYGEKVVRYKYLGGDMYQAYIIYNGKEIPYVGVSSRTGRFHG